MEAASLVHTNHRVRSAAFAAVNAFNASSPVLKKGLALTPVKFGTIDKVVAAYEAGQCDSYTADQSQLYAIRLYCDSCGLVSAARLNQSYSSRNFINAVR